MSVDPDWRKSALVVLGMHRSGTSAMARVLSLSGASLPNDLWPSGSDNERGFWESQSVIALDDELLSAADTDWDDIFAGRPKHHLSNFDRVFRHKAGEVLGAAYGDAETIVLKDPRINVLCAFWDGALRAHDYSPFYIVMVRNPLEVAASLLARNKLPTERSLLLWLDQMLAAERDTRSSKRLFVTYDDLLADWRTCLDRVEQVMERPLPKRNSAASNAIEQFLSASLRHHKLTADGLDGRSELRGMTAQAFAWFLDAAHSNEPTDGKQLDSIRQKLTDLHDTVGPVVSDSRDVIAEYRKHANGLEEMVRHLEYELKAAQGKYDSTEMDRRRLEHLLEEAQNCIERKNDEISQSACHVTEAETELAGITDELRNVGVAGVDGEAPDINARARVISLLAELAQVRSEEGIHRQALEATHEAVRQLQAENGGLGQELADVRAEVDLKDREGAALALELIQLREEDSARNDKLEATRDLVRELETQNTMLVRNVADIQDQLTSEREALRASEADSDILNSRYVELRTELMRLQGVAEEALVRSRALQRELVGAAEDRTAREHLTVELDKLRERKEKAEQTVVTLSVDASGLRARLRDALDAQTATAGDMAALLRQRDAILTSTTWKISSLPRRLLARLRG